MNLPIVPRKADSPYPRGTYSRVARKLGVTAQAVRLVARGDSVSARIAKELRREWLKAQRKANKTRASDAPADCAA